MRRSATPALLCALLALPFAGGCKGEGAGADPSRKLEDALPCIGQPESCLFEKLGPPDRELMGPNPNDKKFVYKDAQLTIKLQPREAPIVFAVATGAIEDVHTFGGDYGGSFNGIHHGDSVDVLKKAWGPGRAASSIDLEAGNTYLDYATKLVTKAGRPVNVTVFYRNDKRGIYCLDFHTY